MKSLSNRILEKSARVMKKSPRSFFEDFNYDDYKEYLDAIIELRDTDKEKFSPSLLVYQYMVQDEKHLKMFQNVAVREGGSVAHAAPLLKKYFDKEFGGDIQDYFRSTVWDYFAKNVDWEAVISCYSAYFADYKAKAEK